MQMRKFMYDSISCTTRATALRATAQENASRGFPVMAEVAAQMADELENRENTRRRDAEERER